MDFQVIQEHIPAFQEALILTFYLGLIGIVLSLIVGFLVACVRFFHVPILAKVASVYTELARNTPLLIQLFFLYYGLPKIGIPMGKEVTAIVGLTFLGGAYMAETFRGSFEQVPKVQVESGRSLGFTNWQLAQQVILPQGLPLAIPSLGANAIFLLKETSVFSAIAIMDLTNTAKDLIGMYYMTREFLFLLVVSYAIIILPMIGLITLFERRFRYA
ncbi:MAG: amino acid ABC transporter permease [Enterococcus sp.]